MPETFGFKENFSANGPPDLVGKFKPDPGGVVVEVYDASGELLLTESFNGVRPAPRVSCYISENLFEKPFDRENGVPGTIHVDGFLKASLEWECPVDFTLPFEVPEYILSTPGAHRLKAWWGSEAK